MYTLQKTITWVSALTTTLVVSASVGADIRLPHIIGDNMVVQRDKPIRIWGWAEPTSQIIVELAGQKNVGIPADDGSWLVQFEPLAAGGPHTMTIRELEGESLHELDVVTVDDILVGEVWLCSGQSNMEWPLSNVVNASDEIAAADHPQLRLFHVGRVISGRLAEDVRGEWRACTPQSVPRFSGVAYFFGRSLHEELDVPIGLIASAWGGTRIEPWTSPAGFNAVPALSAIAEKMNAQISMDQEALKQDPDASPPAVKVNAPAALYFGMIAPIVRFSIRGAIWYQGESNLSDGAMYHEKMKALIHGWREVWDVGRFPFYFVQLAPYRYQGDPRALPAIWEAQTATLALPETGMVVITDIANLGDIHPRNKQDVGRRLALLALAGIYGRQDLVYSGPTMKAVSIEGEHVRVRFNHVSGRLRTRDGKPPDWFEIAGENHTFVRAEARIEGDSVIVWSDQVPQPGAVRFGWHQEAQPNLTNAAGLPAASFRIDSISN